jgi:hypothetical protein
MVEEREEWLLVLSLVGGRPGGRLLCIAKVSHPQMSIRAVLARLPGVSLTIGWCNLQTISLQRVFAGRWRFGCNQHFANIKWPCTNALHYEDIEGEVRSYAAAVGL